MADESAPIQIEFAKAVGGSSTTERITSFSSYAFDRSLLTPAAAFRFTASSVDKATRTAIRGGDLATIYGINPYGMREKLATAIIDETDTHVTPGNVDYILAGRDLIGQLVDNTCVDADNKIQNVDGFTLPNILALLIRQTRIPQKFISQQVPNGTFIFRTNPGETKIGALQRYLDLANCLIWCAPTGQVILGKPNFTQAISGQLIISSSNPAATNCLEGRARRNLNQAIRQIITQLQTLGQVDAAPDTMQNNDPDMLAVAPGRVGRSVYRRFSYGQGTDTVNQNEAVGSQTGSYIAMGKQYSARELARDNMKVLDVEMVVEGHFNENGIAYNVDQMYHVVLEDDDVAEDMMVYSCSFELTEAHGMMTHLRLCRIGTIVAYADAIRRTANV